MTTKIVNILHQRTIPNIQLIICENRDWRFDFHMEHRFGGCSFAGKWIFFGISVIFMWNWRFVKGAIEKKKIKSLEPRVESTANYDWKYVFKSQKTKKSLKCNTINKIINFIESFYFLRMWFKRLKTNQTSFHTDTHIFLICLVTYNFLLC